MTSLFRQVLEAFAAMHFARKPSGLESAALCLPAVVDNNHCRRSSSTCSHTASTARGGAGDPVYTRILTAAPHPYQCQRHIRTDDRAGLGKGPPTESNGSMGCLILVTMRKHMIAVVSLSPSISLSPSLPLSLSLSPSPSLRAGWWVVGPSLHHVAPIVHGLHGYGLSIAATVSMRSA